MTPRALLQSVLGRLVVGPGLAVMTLVVVLAAAACASTADRPVPAAAADAPVETTVGPTPTDPPEPAPTAFAPTPTPTAVPRPTPTPTGTPVRPPGPSDLLRSALASNLDVLDSLAVQYAVDVVSTDGRVILSRNAEQLLLPASNQKLVTAAGVMELLPPDFRFVTEFRLGPDGILYAVGGGDPGITASTIDDVVESLADLGVVELADVVVDPTRHVATRTAPGWLPRNVPWDIGPMSGFMIDRNWHRVDAAYVADPDLGNAQYIVSLVEEAGVEVEGTGAVATAPIPDHPVVARVSSPSLAALVDTMLRWSDNVLAESLVREVALVSAGVGDTPVGTAAIGAHLRSLGLDIVVAGDGSGLSRDNEISARQLTDLLRWARGRPWWPTMYEGLAPASGTGTLASRLDADTTVGNVRAKTGTLADVRALSGVVTTIDGVELEFSLLVNGPDAGLAVDAMDQIVTILASATVEQLG